MKHSENKAAAAWLLRELEAHEIGDKSGHATITIVVCERKVTRIEPGEKVLVTDLMKSS